MHSLLSTLIHSYINVTKEKICFKMFVHECFTLPATYSIVKNRLGILYFCRTPETDSTNHWGLIEPMLRTPCRRDTRDSFVADNIVLLNYTICYIINEDHSEHNKICDSLQWLRIKKCISSLSLFRMFPKSFLRPFSFH